MSIIIPEPSGVPGGPSDAEVRVQREITHEFIMRRPVEIVLRPRERVRKPAGGFGWVEGEPRVPQVVSLLEQGTVGGDPRPTVTQDGVERVVEFELLGEWDAVVARDDVFTHQGKEWEVIDLYHDNGYEVRALVSARG
jgi:hypothetical protein